MQTFQVILTLIKPNCYMTTIDLKDAYYLVKIDDDDTRFLKFLCSWLPCPMVCHQVLESLQN